MIHHISMPAVDTANVAKVLAEVFNGTVTDFRPTDNAYMVWFGDEHGSAVEIYPKDIHLVPNDENAPCGFASEKTKKYTAVHAAIGIEKSREEVYAIAKREGWHAAEFSRGSFSVIEFWLSEIKGSPAISLSL